MRLRHFLTVLVISFLPAALPAELANGDLPVARWYAHVDFVSMQKGEAGKQLYAWLDREVFDELRAEAGFDASKEANSVTALASTEGGIVIVVDGNFSQLTRDRIVALAAASGNFNSFDIDGSPYYFVGGDSRTEKGGEYQLDSLDEGAYVSVALKNKLLVAQSKQQMQQLIKGKGKIPGDNNGAGSLLVLSAQRNFVHAGANAEEFGEDLGWDSNVLRNTRQVALQIAEVAGKIALQGQLITTDANVANSLASIVRGLISLQVFNDDLEPSLLAALQSTSVNVDGATLSINLALDPAVLMDVIN